MPALMLGCYGFHPVPGDLQNVGGPAVSDHKPQNDGMKWEFP